MCAGMWYIIALYAKSASGWPSVDNSQLSTARMRLRRVRDLSLEIAAGPAIVAQPRRRMIDAVQLCDHAVHRIETGFPVFRR